MEKLVSDTNELNEKLVEFVIDGRLWIDPKNFILGDAISAAGVIQTSNFTFIQVA